MWRLGRRLAFSCADGKPARGVYTKAARRGRSDSMGGACVPHTGSSSPPWLIGMCDSLRGKTTADGEPASVTDEKPARHSAGPGGPAD